MALIFKMCAAMFMLKPKEFPPDNDITFWFVCGAPRLKAAPTDDALGAYRTGTSSTSWRMR